MAAKFSMANTSGLFDAGSHVEASDRMQQAMEELKIKNERREQAKRVSEHKKAKEAARNAARASGPVVRVKKSDAGFVKPQEESEEEEEEEEFDEEDEEEGEQQDQESDDEFDFDDDDFADPELER